MYISDNTYTRDEILRMEAGILNKLDFVLTVATPKVFLKRFFKVASAVARADHTTNVLSQFLCELTLLDYNFLRYLPSMIAASCLYLAQHALDKGPWDRNMVHYTRYTTKDMERCVAELLAMWQKAPSHSLQAVQEKYSSARMHHVSSIEPPVTLPPVDA